MEKVEDAPKVKKAPSKKSLNTLNGSLYDKLSNRENTFVGKSDDLSMMTKTRKMKKV